MHLKMQPFMIILIQYFMLIMGNGLKFYLLEVPNAVAIASRMPRRNA